MLLKLDLPLNDVLHLNCVDWGNLFLSTYSLSSRSLNGRKRVRMIKRRVSGLKGTVEHVPFLMELFLGQVLLAVNREC